jgi:hypothetical protein
MNFDQLTRDVRLDDIYTFHQVFRRQEMKTPILVHGGGAVAVACFLDSASKLPYGSVVVMSDLADHYLQAVQQRAEKFDWRPWPFMGLGEGEYAWVRTVHSPEYPGYLAHLLTAVRSTTGPVLLFGGHEEAIAAVDEICKEQDRLVVTVDGTEEALDRFAKFIDRHHFVDIEPQPHQSQWLDRDDWGVVFIDHEPANTRTLTLEKARNKAEFVIVHDVENLIDSALEPTIKDMKFYTIAKNSRPWTAICSHRSKVWSELDPAEEKKRVKIEAQRIRVEETPVEIHKKDTNENEEVIQ